MTDTLGEINRQIDVPQTQEKNLDAKAPWEATRAEFGENFYLHGAPDRIANQIRKQGGINKGGLIRADYDEEHKSTSFAYATEAEGSGHFSRSGKGIKLGTIFVIPLKYIVEPHGLAEARSQTDIVNPELIIIGKEGYTSINLRSRVNDRLSIEVALQPAVKWVAEIPADMVPKDPHRYLVEKALKEGKNVPKEVLEDYPDLITSK